MIGIFWAKKDGENVDIDTLKCTICSVVKKMYTESKLFQKTTAYFKN